MSDDRKGFFSKIIDNIKQEMTVNPEMKVCQIFFIFFCEIVDISSTLIETLVLPTSDHRVSGSNPTRGLILSEPKPHFIAQRPSCSLIHRPDMTEILLKRM